jgi:hypothetical protein
VITLPAQELKKMAAIVAKLDDEYRPWKAYHKELAEFILPLRYNWLSENANDTGTVVRARIESVRNNLILDPTGTKAVRDLAAGMLNGIMSPARPWFNIRLKQFFPDNKVPIELARWTEEVRRRMFVILAESNFYDTIVVFLTDLGVFGTSVLLMYDDFSEVIRFYNVPVGEFRLAQNERREVDTLARIELMTVVQVAERFGVENLSLQTKMKYERNGADLYHAVRVYHLLEPNREDARFIPGGFLYREFYWEVGTNSGERILERAAYREKPACFARWDVVGNDTYGLSPGMDALPDIIQLQHETIRKGEALDKMTNPPIVVDAALRNRGSSTQPGGETFVPSYSQTGAKALYQISMPIAELGEDIKDVQQRIRDSFFNDLFRMISNLDTVRSATEIDARREEKLILLGSVLERLKNETLDPLMIRLFALMKRKELIPPLPPGFEEVEIEIQYVSMLSDAQRAVGTGVIERFMQVVGNTAALVPEVRHIPDWQELLREYGNRLNVPPNGIRSREEVETLIGDEKKLAEAQQAALVGQQLTGAAKNLSETDLGGGRNAFQALLS